MREAALPSRAARQLPESFQRTTSSHLSAFWLIFLFRS